MDTTRTLAFSLAVSLPLLASACAHDEAVSGSGDDAGEHAGDEGGDGDGDGDGDGGEGDGGDGGDGSDDALLLPAGHSVNTGRVATADTCAECHTNADGAEAMRDEDARPIAPQDLWQSTMMANSARDPFWHAMVEAETLATPAAAEAIEAKCTRCHAPLLSAELELTGAGGAAMATLQEESSDHGALGLDGVSCTLCHQVEDEGLGDPSTFSGNWVVAGEGRIYGPHAAPFEMPMVSHLGMTPVEGQQVRDSGMCATCHTLSTDALSPEGEAVGASLPEQTPYLEWQNSAFNTEVDEPEPEAASCQDCHVPQRSVDGELISTKIARRPMGDDFPPIDARDSFGRHIFVGGNVTMLQLIRDQAAVLRPNAPAAAFDASIAVARDQLSSRTADVSIAEVIREGDGLQIPVSVANLAGHKLPTGFPSRRVFLQLEVRNGEDEVVFRSGGFDDRGRLLGTNGEPLEVELAAGPTAPHLDEVSTGDQVQIWEAIMADPEGAPTYRLLRASGYVKDDRLLPLGWDPAFSTPDIAPHGVEGDADYESAGDTVTYLVAAPMDAGPYTIEARAYYQPLSPRFLAELFAMDGPKIRAFEAMIEVASLAPELLGSASATAE